MAKTSSTYRRHHTTARAFCTALKSSHLARRTRRWSRAARRPSSITIATEFIIRTQVQTVPYCHSSLCLRARAPSPTYTFWRGRWPSASISFGVEDPQVEKLSGVGKSFWATREKFFFGVQDLGVEEDFFGVEDPGVEEDFFGVEDLGVEEEL